MITEKHGRRERGTSSPPAGIAGCLAFCLVTLASGMPARAEEASERQRSERVIVVCPEAFRESLQPWVDQRQSESMDIVVIASEASAEQLHQAIGAAAKQTGETAEHTAANEKPNRYVLLVGDAPAIGKACDPARQVPTHYHATAITAIWGSTPEAPSDLKFGDFDQDGEMDAAVGRFPVQTPEQLRKLVSKILAYEQSEDFGSWRGEVQLTGGVGGFGPLVDTAIESVTRTLVTSALPTEIKTTVAYASPGHLFYPQEPSFTEAVLARYARGARFWVYAGHGWVDSLDRVPQTAMGRPVLDNESVGRLHQASAGVAPIALLLACYTGAYDAPQDCLGEKMLLAPSGPVAVFAGSRMTMPYGNTVTAVGLIDGVYRERLPRLGDAWLETLHTLHREEEVQGSSIRMVIDSLATMISPAGTTLAAERREHSTLYNLLGDPTLRMHHPHSITLSAPTGTARGEAIEIDVESPIDGELVVTLDRPLGSVTTGDPNQTTVATVEAQVTANRSSRLSLSPPPGMHGPMIIRVLVRGPSTWATAAARTLVR